MIILKMKQTQVKPIVILVDIFMKSRRVVSMLNFIQYFVDIAVIGWLFTLAVVDVVDFITKLFKRVLCV